MNRPRRLAVLLTPFVLLAAAAATGDGIATVAAGTPGYPDGQLVIEGGKAWTNDPVLDLDVTATDDVGVISVRIRADGGAWHDYAYSPQLQFSLGSPASLEDREYFLEAEWRDGAGNGATDSAIIGYDGTPPTLLQFQETTPEGPNGTVTFAFQVDESFNGTGKARFSSNGGTTWGSAVDLPGSGTIVWNPNNVSLGGSKLLGPRTVSAQVRDQAGNWSNTRSTSIVVQNAVAIDVSGNLVTGQQITLTPTWDHPVSFPAGTICRWSFAWGNDASLYASDHDETYGSVLVAGKPADGYCDEWRFTLPWTPVRQYLVTFTVIHDDILAEASIGGSAGAPNLNVSVGSTSRDITSSNLPMLYVLPEQWELQVGVPAVYTAHGVGGTTVRSTDDWHVEITDHQDLYPGSASLTFTPTVPGHVTVCLYRSSAQGPLLGACYDPPVKRAASGGGGGASPAPGATTSASVGPDASGAVGTAAPGPSLSGAPSTMGPAASTDGSPGETAAPTAATPEAPITANGSAPGALLLVGLVALAIGAGRGAAAWRRGWRPRMPGGEGT